MTVTMLKAAVPLDWLHLITVITRVFLVVLASLLHCPFFLIYDSAFSFIVSHYRASSFPLPDDPLPSPAWPAFHFDATN